MGENECGVQEHCQCHSGDRAACFSSWRSPKPFCHRRAPLALKRGGWTGEGPFLVTWALRPLASQTLGMHFRPPAPTLGRPHPVADQNPDSRAPRPPSGSATLLIITCNVFWAPPGHSSFPQTLPTLPPGLPLPTPDPVSSSTPGRPGPGRSPPASQVSEWKVKTIHGAEGCGSSPSSR